MTNSMVPYSFIPGTKAKADEVNANFLALANLIEQNKELSSDNIQELKNILQEKAEKSELIKEHTVTTAETDLNDYKTSGTYIFSSLYKPTHIPKGSSGILIVAGDENSEIKQIWFCDDVNGEIYVRHYKESKWCDWNAILGKVYTDMQGYLKFPNGFIIQYGHWCQKQVTYPLAFTRIACPVYSKHGFATATERSDTGFTSQTLTGFYGASNGVFESLNWVAMGF